MAEVFLSDGAKQRLAPVLGRFGPSTGTTALSARVAVDRDHLPVPWLAHLVLVQIIGCQDHGPADKTLWRVPFHYDHVEALLTHEKFGVRLYLDLAGDSDANGEVLAREIVGKLSAIVKTVERDSLKDLAEQKLVDGKVTILNQDARLRRAFEHFRGLAEQLLAESEAPDTREVGTPGDDGWLTKGISRRFERLEAGAFNAIAAINAYFSWLEHVLALALAFTNQDPSGGTLREHLKDRWAEKFRRVFDTRNADVNRVLAELHDIAETYRNTFGHGGFDKLGATHGVQIEGIGVVPARLTDVRRSPHFELFPFKPASFGEVAARLDEIDRFLRDGPCKLALRFIESGLDVPFDEGSRHEYQRAMTSEERFAQLLARWSEQVDRYDNMDF